jgi:hypothetical protein
VLGRRGRGVRPGGCATRTPSSSTWRSATCTSCWPGTSWAKQSGRCGCPRSLVVKVPHHGSRTSSGPAFVARRPPGWPSSRPAPTTRSATPIPRWSSGTAGSAPSCCAPTGTGRSSRDGREAGLGADGRGGRAAPHPLRGEPLVLDLAAAGRRRRPARRSRAAFARGPATADERDRQAFHRQRPEALHAGRPSARRNRGGLASEPPAAGHRPRARGAPSGAAAGTAGDRGAIGGTDFSQFLIGLACPSRRAPLVEGRPERMRRRSAGGGPSVVAILEMLREKTEGRRSSPRRRCSRTSSSSCGWRTSRRTRGGGRERLSRPRAPRARSPSPGGAARGSGGGRGDTFEEQWSAFVRAEASGDAAAAERALREIRRSRIERNVSSLDTLGLALVERGVAMLEPGSARRPRRPSARRSRSRPGCRTATPASPPACSRRVRSGSSPASMPRWPGCPPSCRPDAARCGASATSRRWPACSRHSGRVGDRGGAAPPAGGLLRHDLEEWLGPRPGPLGGLALFLLVLFCRWPRSRAGAGCPCGGSRSSTSTSTGAESGARRSPCSRRRRSSGPACPRSSFAADRGTRSFTPPSRRWSRSPGARRSRPRGGGRGRPRGPRPPLPARGRRSGARAATRTPRSCTGGCSRPTPRTPWRGTTSRTSSSPTGGTRRRAAATGRARRPAAPRRSRPRRSTTCRSCTCRSSSTRPTTRPSRPPTAWPPGWWPTTTAGGTTPATTRWSTSGSTPPRSGTSSPGRRRGRGAQRAGRGAAPLAGHGRGSPGQPVRRVARGALLAAFWSRAGAGRRRSRCTAAAAGRPSAACHLGQVSGGLCSQCYHLFVVRDGVSGPARNRKMAEVQRADDPARPGVPDAVRPLARERGRSTGAGRCGARRWSCPGTPCWPARRGRGWCPSPRSRGGSRRRGRGSRRCSPSLVVWVAANRFRPGEATELPARPAGPRRGRGPQAGG